MSASSGTASPKTTPPATVRSSPTPSSPRPTVVSKHSSVQSPPAPTSLPSSNHTHSSGSKRAAYVIPETTKNGTYETTSSRYGDPGSPPAAEPSSHSSAVSPAKGRLCTGEDVCFSETIQDIQAHITALKAELESYKTPLACSRVCGYPLGAQQQQRPSLPPPPPPVCMCGVATLQEENIRLRQGLVAKHNEVVHLRGLMIQQTNNVYKNGSALSCRSTSGSATGSRPMLMLCAAPAPARLPAGGLCARGTAAHQGGMQVQPVTYGAAGGNYPGMGAQQHQGGVYCHLPGCPNEVDVGAMTSNVGGYPGSVGGGYVSSGPVCGSCPYATGGYPDATGGYPNATEAYPDARGGSYLGARSSATAIIEESKRQMEETENEIKYKLREIKGKKNALEDDIAKLQKILLEKQQVASVNMQAARASRAAELAQAAQMATEQQKQQRKQAQEAAQAAMQLKQAQDEQSRKQTMAAKASEMAQQAQYHQLMMASQAAEAAQRAEDAQREQAEQAENAAQAAEAVRAAQEQQNRLAAQQLEDAEELKRVQEEQASRTVQATEALHAAHVTQVAQQAQACQATTQAHTILTEHKYTAPPQGCEELERGMRLNMTGPMAVQQQQQQQQQHGHGPPGFGGPYCCNPNCANYAMT